MPPIRPMLAKSVSILPEGMLYEPKWDGFRCVVFRDGDEVELGSRKERPLTRYFPEIVEAARTQLPPRCVVDGEIVIASGPGLDFEALLQRIHPAASRVNMLATETPAMADRLRPARPGRRVADGAAPGRAPGRPRGGPGRGGRARVHHTRSPTRMRQAERWFRVFEGAGLDGVIAKPRDLPYLEDQRVMFKVKHERTADCVVAGFRWHKKGPVVGSLLLGLHDEEGRLQHVGVSASFSMERRRELLDELAPYRLEQGAEHPWTGYSTPERVPGAHGLALERQEGPDLRAASPRSWWSRWPTTTWRATASATPPSSGAGATTATRSPAPTSQIERPVEFDLGDILAGGGRA